MANSKRVLPIKFRGVDVETGDYRYGDLLTTSHGTFCISWFADDGSGRKYFKVFADSVAQLVGYDADGREVYEGDDLYLDYPEDHFHKEYKAECHHLAVAADGCRHSIGKVYLKCGK